MTTSTIIKLVLAGIFLISILFSNLLRSTSSSAVNKLIKDAKKHSDQKQNLKAIEILKNALSEVLGFRSNNWSLYEIKDNVNTNGWFILNQLKRLYALENISFDITIWSKLIGELNGIERHSKNDILKATIKAAYDSLP